MRFAFHLSCAFVSLEAVTLLENLNLSFIVPLLAKVVFPTHKVTQTVLINA